MKERIGDICTLKSGTTLKEDMLIEDGPIPYVKVSDMNLAGNEKYIVTANSYVDNNISEKMLFPKGTVLFPKRGGAIGTNKKRIASKSVCADLNTMGVIPSERIRPLFLYYYFINIDFGTLYNGSSVPQINNTDIAPMEIDLPSLDEQDKALAQLEKVDFLIQKRTEQLAKMDELIKARFVEMFGDPVQNPFGWKKKRFDEICENLDSRRKPITSSDRVEGIYPYYGASGIVDYVEDYIFDEDILLVSEDGANLLMRSTPIAFSVSGKVWVNNHAHVVRFGKMCLQKYIEIFFSLIDISDSITGSAQPKLNQAKLNAMEFPIPDERRLEEYLSFLEQVDKSKVAVKKALDETKTLFDSLMQEYFG